MTPTRIIMLSYERDFLDPASEASARLQRLIDDGHRITAIVIASGKEAVREFSNGRALSFSGNAVTRYSKAFFAVLRETKKSRANGETVVLSAQDPFIAGMIAFKTSRFANIPYEIQEHGDFFSGAWEKESFAHRLWTIPAGILLRRADGIRVVSERVRNRLISRYKISPEKIVVYPVVSNLTGLQPRESRPWPDVPTLIAPCRFTEQKGLDVLLDACVDLKKRGQKFKLRFVGSGPLEKQIKSDIIAMGLSGDVSVEPWADRNTMWRDADAFVLSSNYEGWGRTIVEAMATGVAVVTTDVGCVGSLFRPQVDGIVVQPDDASALASGIMRMLEDEKRREWFIANARERVSTLPSSQDVMRSQYEAWDRIVGSEAGSRTPPLKLRGTGKSEDSLAPRSSLLAPSSRKAWMITLALIVFASLIRLVSLKLFWHSMGPNREWGFYTLVHQWFQGFGYTFANQAGCASAYRSPGYLFFLTAVYGLFGMDNFFAQAVVQNIFAVLIVYLVYRLGWRLTGDRRVGWVAGFLIALHPYTFYHYTQYYHTFLSSTFLVLVILAIVQLERTRKIGYAILGGIAIASLAYVQGTILPLAPFLCMWLLWRWRKGSWKKAIGMSVLMGVIAAVLIAPWTIRNWTIFHRFIPLTTDLGLGFYKANNEDIYALTKLGFPQEVVGLEVINPADPLQVKYTMYPEAIAALSAEGAFKDMAFWTEWHPHAPDVRGNVACSQISDMSEPDASAHWMALGMDWLKKNYVPDGIKLQALKFTTFWSPALEPSLKYGAEWSFGNTGLIATFARDSLILYVSLAIIFMLAGIVIMVRRKKFGDIVPILIILVGYSFFHSFFAGYTKYRIPLDNLVVVLAAIAVVGCWDVWKNRRR